MPALEPITRIVIRRGFETERKEANLFQGEPAYAVDSKRLYIGDGTTTGGNPIGMRNCMFATFFGNQTGISTSYAPTIGDIVYDTVSKLLYTLVDPNFQLVSSWVPIGTSLTGNGLTISTDNDTIAIIPNSITFYHVDVSTAIGRGLEVINTTTLQLATPSPELSFISGRLSITPARVTNTMLSNMAANTIKGRTVAAGSPQDIPFDQFASLIAPFILQYAPAVAVVQPGTVLDYAGTAAPQGYLICNGAAVSRTTYASLFNAIGTTWGVGNGTTTFNLPNLSRRTTVGAGGVGTTALGNQVGNLGGQESVLITANQTGLRQHNHTAVVTINQAHTHTLNHTHTLDHTHTLSHTHTLDHTHTLSHTHTLAHTHSFIHQHIFGQANVLNNDDPIFPTVEDTSINLPSGLYLGNGASGTDLTYAPNIRLRICGECGDGNSQLAYTWNSSRTGVIRPLITSIPISMGIIDGSLSENLKIEAAFTTSQPSTNTTSGASTNTTSSPSTTTTSQPSTNTTSGASTNTTSAPNNATTSQPNFTGTTSYDVVVSTAVAQPAIEAHNNIQPSAVLLKIIKF